MKRLEHQKFNKLIESFFCVLKEKYSERYYHMRITESKSKSPYFVFQKKKG